MRWSTFVSSFALSTLAIVAMACSPSSVGGDDDDDDEPTVDAGTDPRCTGDEHRCVGREYQACVDGAFETTETCAASCDVELGCIECNPDRGNTCNGDQVVECNADGSFGTVVETCAEGSECRGGDCNRACSADGVDLIYVVDDSYNLLSFDPRKIGTADDPFTSLGRLDCPAGDALPIPLDPNPPGPATPFSMSVDRNGVAWVLYSSGEVFKVPVSNVGACAATGYQALQQSFLVFGMGFVTDTAGGDTETLYVGGGTIDADPERDKIGHIDTGSLALTLTGDIRPDAEQSPELTGTGNAELFGFFPGLSNAFVQELDRDTGAGMGAPLDLGSLGGLFDFVEAWAFAQWGGRFYVFVTITNQFNPLETNSQVVVVDRASGDVTTPISELPYKIVGAGVSTCAPVVID